MMHRLTGFLSVVLLVSVASALTVTDNQPRGNVTCFKVETDAATYYLDKYGAGFASMVDAQNRDWISFDRNVSGSSGEYRGIPNAVHQQDIDGFHARNSSTDQHTVTKTSETAHTAVIKGTCGNWEGIYEFYETHCTFTMNKMTAGKAYWILYEGTPYGVSQAANSWFYKSNNNTKYDCNTNMTADLPDPEWVAFGHNSSPRVLLLINHDGGGQTDRYYWMNPMTVFGFGRGASAGNKYFTTVPKSFSFTFVESTNHGVISALADDIISGAVFVNRPDNPDYTIAKQAKKAPAAAGTIFTINPDESLMKNAYGASVIYSVNGRLERHATPAAGQYVIKPKATE